MHVANFVLIIFVQRTEHHNAEISALSSTDQWLISGDLSGAIHVMDVKVVMASIQKLCFAS